MNKDRSARIRTIAFCTVFATLSALFVGLGSTSRAATGDSYFIDCLRLTGRALEGCVESRAGLSNPTRTVTSPDGAFVYVLGDDVTVMRRNADTGGLDPVVCYGVGSGCTTLAWTHRCPLGWCWITDLVISADGKNAYSTLRNHDVVAAYARDPLTGRLTYLSCMQDQDSTVQGFCTRVPALKGPTRLALTDSGDRNLYVTGIYSNSLVWFRRNTVDGQLSLQGCTSDSGSRRIGNCGILPGLSLPGPVQVSPDGNAVYVGTYNTLLAFDRSHTSGALTLTQCLGNLQSASDPSAPAPSNCTPRPGLSSLHDIAISPEGRSVYTAAYGSDSIGHFGRANGSFLGFFGCKRDVRKAAAGCDAAIYVAGTSDLEVARDGLSLYATGYSSGSLVPFNRTLADGRLAQAGCFLDHSNPGDGCTKVEGLAGASGVSLTPDAKSMYAVGNIDDTLARFTREASPSLPPPADFTAPDTQITDGPARRTTRHAATFSFTASEAASFECKLDARKWKPCSSPAKYTRLANGRHAFRVAAIDDAGNRDRTPAIARFRVV